MGGSTMSVLFGVLSFICLIFLTIYLIASAIDGFKKRPSSSRRKSLYAFIALVICIIGGVSTTESSDSSSKLTPVSTNSPDLLTLQLKENLSKQGVSSDVTIKVMSSKYTSKIANSFLSEKANGIFKIVKVQISNGQKDAITVDSSSFKLLDEQDREFTISSKAQSVSMSNEESFFLYSLNPGLSVTGQLIFDVPSKKGTYRLKAQGGMTGDDIELKVD